VIGGGGERDEVGKDEGEKDGETPAAVADAEGRGFRLNCAPVAVAAKSSLRGVNVGVDSLRSVVKLNRLDVDGWYVDAARACAAGGGTVSVAAVLAPNGCDVARACVGYMASKSRSMGAARDAFRCSSAWTCAR
jgi:hypothetical protein